MIVPHFLPLVLACPVSAERCQHKPARLTLGFGGDWQGPVAKYMCVLASLLACCKVSFGIRCPDSSELSSLPTPGAGE